MLIISERILSKNDNTNVGQFKCAIANKKLIFVGFNMEGDERLAQCLSAGFDDFGLNQRSHMLHKQTTSVKLPIFQTNNSQENSTRLEPSRHRTCSDCAPGKLPTRWEVAAPPQETPKTPQEAIINDHVWGIIWFRLPLKQHFIDVCPNFPCVRNYMKKVSVE